MQLVDCEVILPNQQSAWFKVLINATGSALLKQVQEYLNITEWEYFGLHFDNSSKSGWLEPNKLIRKQVGKAFSWVFNFLVKFYPSHPDALNTSTAKHFMSLQLQSSAKESKLSSIENRSNSLPSTTPLHGISKHFLKDSASDRRILGIKWNGIDVYRDGTLLRQFKWSNIAKISFYENKFIITSSKTNENVQKIVYKFSSSRAAKNAWKSSVEHHSFFRLKTADSNNVGSHRLFSFGSKFRYIGRTYHELQANLLEHSHHFPGYDDALALPISIPVTQDLQNNFVHDEKVVVNLKGPSNATIDEVEIKESKAFCDADTNLDLTSFSYDDQDRYSEPPVLEITKHQQAVKRWKYEFLKVDCSRKTASHEITKKLSSLKR